MLNTKTILSVMGEAQCIEHRPITTPHLQLEAQTLGTLAQQPLETTVPT